MTSVLCVLEPLECCKCGMPMGLSSQWVMSARRLGGFRQQFYCPYCGKQQGWGESQHEKEVKRLTQERDAALGSVKRREETIDYLTKESEHFRKSRDGWKGVAVKTKKRVAAGVCPCCSRHFPNDKMATHIATKHPDFNSSSEPHA